MNNWDVEWTKQTSGGAMRGIPLCTDCTDDNTGMDISFRLVELPPKMPPQEGEDTFDSRMAGQWEVRIQCTTWEQTDSGGLGGLLPRSGCCHCASLIPLSIPQVRTVRTLHGLEEGQCLDKSDLDRQHQHQHWGCLRLVEAGHSATPLSFSETKKETCPDEGR